MDKPPPLHLDESEIPQGINDPCESIKRLATALIIRAILDARHEVVPGVNEANITRDDVRTAIEWLLRSESEEPASFSWCCGVLNFRPVELRRRIKAIPKGAMKKIFYY